MPNGGSDCCGTCWFNEANKGKQGFSPGPAFCTIRELPVPAPFYTYCGNHPHRRPERDPIPIGPVFTGDSAGDRTLWKPSPDTEAVRGHLLDLLSRMEEVPRPEYPIGLPVEEVVVWQLGEFRETRALEDLRRVASFDPASQADGPFRQSRGNLVRLAREALDTMERGSA